MEHPWQDVILCCPWNCILPSIIAHDEPIPLCTSRMHLGEGQQQVVIEALDRGYAADESSRNPLTDEERLTPREREIPWLFSRELTDHPM